MFKDIRRAIVASLGIQVSVFVAVAFFFRLSAEVAAMGRPASISSVNSLTGGNEGAMAAIAIAIAMIVGGLAVAATSAVRSVGAPVERSFMNAAMESQIVQRYCVAMFAALAAWGVLAMFVAGRTNDAVTIALVATAMMFLVGLLRSKPKKA